MDSPCSAWRARIVLGVATFILTIAAASSAATLRPDGLLDVDGRPFFPLGLFDLGAWKHDDWHERVVTSGVNCVWDYESAYEDTLPTCRAIVDSARAGGYRLLIGSRHTIHWDDLLTPELEVGKPIYEKERLGALLTCAADTPGVILGYTNRDEPVWTLSRGWLGDIDADHIFDTYALLHRTIPGTFVATNFAPAHLSGEFDAWKQDLLPFLDATDVVMHASYPYPAGPGTCGPWNVLGYPDCPLDRLAANATLFLGEINRPGQPLWMVIQAFKNIPPREARWTAYASVVQGATGIFWAGWTWEHELGNGEGSRHVIEPVIAEVVGLHDFLVGRDVPGVSASHPDVELRARKHVMGTEIVAFAVSRRGFAGSVDIRLPRAGEGSATVVGEGRAVPVSAGWIRDHFEPYEAHVYRYFAHRLRSDPVPSSRDEPRLAVSSLPGDERILVRLELPREASALLSVYDVRGRRVALLASGNFESGVSEILWGARDDAGRSLAAGVYFVRAKTTAGDPPAAKLLLDH